MFLFLEMIIRKVLILILVEDSRRQDMDIDKVGKYISVLILILVEDSRRQSARQLGGNGRLCLNPYSSGR